MRRKCDLDRLTAEATGLSQRTVSKVTRAWIESLREVLIEDGTVFVDTMGTFRVQIVQSSRDPKSHVLLVKGNFKKKGNVGLTVLPMHQRLFVRFHKAEILRQQLKLHYVPPAGDNEDD